MDRCPKSMMAAGMLALVSLAAQADGDAGRGRKLAYSCMGCHGVDYYKNAFPNYSVPRLGGQNAPYVVSALEQYQSGDRMHPTMRGFASSLAAEDRRDLAAFFHSQVPAASGPAPVGTPPPQAAACTACHGQNGRGTTPEYPNIGGQHADYIAQALNDYRLGRRKNAVMAAFAQQLTKGDIEVLARYFSAQNGLVTPVLD
jgi:cytochrome c553